MIQGHGDDLWRFGREVRANFSSNVYARVDLGGLKRHLASRLDVISNYPEPEPYTLEAAIAASLGIPAETVCVTAGATEAIYLIANAWKGSRTAIVQPTFSEYEDACHLHGHMIVEDTPDMVWFCNPNNPTGSVVDVEDVKNMVSDKHIIFIIDQSYGYATWPVDIYYLYIFFSTGILGFLMVMAILLFLFVRLAKDHSWFIYNISFPLYLASLMSALGQVNLFTYRYIAALFTAVLFLAPFGIEGRREAGR